MRTAADRVRFLCPSWRAQQATESVPPARQSLASYPWHILYAKNSNSKSHNGDVTGTRSSKLMNNGMAALLLLFCFAFGVTPGNTQGLLLALHSEITPGGAQRTIWELGVERQPAVLPLQPLFLLCIVNMLCIISLELFYK